MKFGYIRQDEDSHNYLVPENEVQDFDRLTKEMENHEDTDEWYDKVDEFNEKFAEYRINGIESLKVLME